MSHLLYPTLAEKRCWFFRKNSFPSCGISKEICAPHVGFYFLFLFFLLFIVSRATFASERDGHFINDCRIIEVFEKRWHNPPNPWPLPANFSMSVCFRSLVSSLSSERMKRENNAMIKIGRMSFHVFLLLLFSNFDIYLFDI